MKRHLLTTSVLLLLFNIGISSQNYFETDGIRYRIIKEADGENAYGTVSVAKAEFGSYEGKIVIPSVVKESNDKYADSYKVVAIDDYAFSPKDEYSPSITAISFSPTIEQIGKFAFWGSNLKTLSIPAGNLQEIGERAFYVCRSLERVELPSTVKTIQAYAFASCYKLKSISMPGVKQIGESAFASCYELEEVRFLESLLRIGNFAFAGCEKLSKVEGTTSLRSIGDHAFDGCSELASMNLPESLQDIGEGAFIKTGISAIKIPDNIRVIKMGVFSQSKLRSVVLPAHLQRIEAYAFAYLNMDVIDIPGGVIIHPSAFYQTTYLDKNEVQRKISAFKKLKNPYIVTVNTNIQNSIKWNGCLFDADVIPQKGEEYGFITLVRADSAQLQGDVVIPDAFVVQYKNSAIQYIVKDIDKYAFNDCKKMTTIKLPAIIDKIPLFQHCSGLKTFTFPKNCKITTIPVCMFYECKSLHAITLPNGITKIGKLAFKKSGLEEIVIPEGVDSIGEEAFAECSLKKVTLPSTLKVIQSRAFMDNKSLTNIVLPKSLERIERSAFYSSPFDTIRIPANVKVVEGGALYSARNIFIEGNPEEWHGGVFNSRRIRSIHITDDSYIKTYALRDAPYGVVISPQTYELQRQKEEDAKLLASIDKNKKVFNSKDDVLNYLRSHIFYRKSGGTGLEFNVRLTEIISYGYEINKIEVVAFTKTSAKVNCYVQGWMDPFEYTLEIKDGVVTMTEKIEYQTSTFIVGNKE